jgi:hypothetical protein
LALSDTLLAAKDAAFSAASAAHSSLDASAAATYAAASWRDLLSANWANGRLANLSSYWNSTLDAIGSRLALWQKCI